jgi:hypothetical protein
MAHQNCLDSIPKHIIQKIFQSIFSAGGEDYQEAENYLDLQTHISKPFVKWDLFHRNLIRNFSESKVLFSSNKRGMWEVLLLYERESRMLLSFMSDARFKEIQRNEPEARPKYIQALTLLNEKLDAKRRQKALFDAEESDGDTEELRTLLNSLCNGFTEPVDDQINHHVLVVFSSNYGQVTSLKAYVLDSDFGIVYEQDWLDKAKPILSIEVGKISRDETEYIKPKLTAKATKRMRPKELVSLRTSDTSVPKHG